MSGNYKLKDAYSIESTEDLKSWCNDFLANETEMLQRQRLKLINTVKDLLGKQCLFKGMKNKKKVREIIEAIILYSFSTMDEFHELYMNNIEIFEIGKTYTPGEFLISIENGSCECIISNDDNKKSLGGYYAPYIPIFLDCNDTHSLEYIKPQIKIYHM